MLPLNDLFYFVKAVEHGGFAPAGRQLNLPKSTISKRVAALEDRLQAKLLHRTSRSFQLTDVGRAFFEHARAALIEAENAEATVRERHAEPSGTVRLTASVPTAQMYLAPVLPSLAEAYPKMHLCLHASDRFVDIIQEGYDIAVRSHFGPLPSSGLIQRQLVTEPIHLIASPAYLARAGCPVRPEDLASHNALLTGAGAEEWRLVHEKSGEQCRVRPQARMTADESQVLLEGAVAGLGITRLPRSFCKVLLARGDLVQVLPGWQAGQVTTTLLMPERRMQLPGVRAVVDFLVERLSLKAET